MDDLAALRDSHDGLMEQLAAMGPGERAEVRQRMMANLVTCRSVLDCLDLIEGSLGTAVPGWSAPPMAPQRRREPRLPRF